MKKAFHNQIHHNFKIFDLVIASTKTKYIKLNTKTQNIFCRLNENLMTFLYTLTGATRKQREKKKFSLLKCIHNLNVMKKIIWVLVFGIMYLDLVYPMTKSENSNKPIFFQNIKIQTCPYLTLH